MNCLDAIQESKVKVVSIEVKTNGDAVDIHVVDTGHGVPDERKHRVMEPIFTTKGSQRGVGLGLQATRGMLESQGGSLNYRRDEPQATFVMQLRKAMSLEQKTS